MRLGEGVSYELRLEESEEIHQWKRKINFEIGMVYGET